MIHLKQNTEFTQKLLENKHIFDEIYTACGNKFMKGCGSYLFDGNTYTYCDAMYDKQELYTIAKSCSSVLEIGTYMGHSILIMLLANKNLKITCIDIQDTYALPAITVLNKYFNNAITFIHSDSISALEKMNNKKFDLFHIDGFHDNDYIKKEFELIKHMSSTDILHVMFDDQECLIPLQNELFHKYEIIKVSKPECKWNNLYLEIKL